MQEKRSRIENSEIHRDTYYGKKQLEETIQRARDMEADVDSVLRKQDCLCPLCYYAGHRIVMAAFWNVSCRVCDTEMQFSSSNTDELCEPCAKKNKLCKKCGRQVDLKTNKTETYIKENNA